eukprot:INCI67.1.p1 GENE.INCI67.1~~INCI67.1.p1  ORF type:complete len:364 (+),score=64.95 INCI67.1:277-1368(+)
MHLSSFSRRKKTKKRKTPKAWQVDLGLVSKDEYVEEKRKREEEERREREKGEASAAGSSGAGGGMKGITSFATTTTAASKKSSWSKIKQEVRLAQKLEAEQEKIEERKKEMLLRSLGKSEKGRGSLHYLDVEVTDLIPTSGVRIVRASGRMIFEIFDDIVPNLARVFTDMVQLIAEGQVVYECGNNDMGFRCVWNQHDQKLDEAAMDVRSRSEPSRFPGRLPTSRDFNWELLHACPGIVSMVLDPKAAGLDPQDKGLHRKGFNFQITSRPADELDEMCPVFGRLKSGYALLKYIQDLGTLPKAMTIHLKDGGRIPSDADLDDYERLLEISPEWAKSQNNYRISTHKLTGNPRAVSAMMSSLNA